MFVCAFNTTTCIFSNVFKLISMPLSFNKTTELDTPETHLCIGQCEYITFYILITMHHRCVYYVLFVCVYHVFFCVGVCVCVYMLHSIAVRYKYMYSDIIFLGSHLSMLKQSQFFSVVFYTNFYTYPLCSQLCFRAI